MVSMFDGAIFDAGSSNNFFDISEKIALFNFTTIVRAVSNITTLLRSVSGNTTVLRATTDNTTIKDVNTNE